MPAPAADIGVRGDVRVRSQGLKQDIADAVGAYGRAVRRDAASVQRDVARSGAQHDRTIATGRADTRLQRIGHRRISHRAVGKHSVHRHRHVVHDQVTGFEHADAAVGRTGAQCDDRRLQMIDRIPDGRARMQPQARRNNVLIHVVRTIDQRVRIQNTALRRSDAHLAGGQHDVAHRHILHRMQSRLRRNTRAQEQTRRRLGDRTHTRHHVDAAAACDCARRADVGIGVERHMPCRQHTDVAALAHDVRVRSNIRSRTQSLDQDITGSVRTDRLSVFIGRTVVERYMTGRRPDNYGAVIGGRHIALYYGFTFNGRPVRLDSADCNRHVIDY